MNRGLVVLATLAVAVVPPAARANGPTLGGALCRYETVVVQSAPDYDIGVVTGGPIAAATLVTFLEGGYRDLMANPVSVTLICSVRTGVTGFTYADPPEASVSTSGPAVAVVPPTPLTIYRPFTEYLGTACTEVVLRDAYGATQHLYWDTWAQQFSTDPGTSCAVVSCPASARSYDPCHGASDDVLDAVVGVLDDADDILCSELAHVYPPDGDVWVGDVFIWDCPPYAT